MSNRSLQLGVKVFAGLFAVAMSALPQAYTISAKPGAVNYIEGDASLDGQPLGSASLKTTFLNAGTLLETQAGKVEVLLTPGVFLRVGENSRVRMLKASLVDTQLAVEAGESMIEVDQYVKESRLTVSMRGGITDIQKIGLYRFMSEGAEPAVDVIDGKAEVSFGDKHVSLGKGHEALLTDALKTQDFDRNREDDLYAWSNIRSQYNASLTYQAARSAASSSGGGNSMWGGYGYPGYYGQGWYWSNPFNSWLWMPGDSFFYSPFGWGFYGPGLVGYAPVVTVPVVVAGGLPVKPILPGKPVARTVVVPVNPKAVPPIGVYSKSVAGFQAASAQAAHSVAQNGGLRTYSGARAASFSGSGSHVTMNGGGVAASRGSASGGFSGGGAAHAASAGGGGGAHAASAGGGGGSHGK